MNLYSTNNQHKRQLPAFESNTRLNDPALYRPSAELVDAVNVALTLGIPLLLTGEPGTGKTQLAHHLAWFFELGEPLVFNAQTSSLATDLFYQYDALGHFQYSQNHAQALSVEELERRFIRYKALGQAIVSDSRRVVLIDEIDKAPRDLPNDVLAALDELSFYVPEIDKRHTTQPANRPVIILTSNSEKNLPDPFLRRVAYFHIDFPSHDKLLEIVGTKIEGLTDVNLEALVNHFEDIREDQSLRLQKKPATAELVQWASWLNRQAFPLELLEDPKNMDHHSRQLLKASYSILAKTREDLLALKKKW